MRNINTHLGQKLSLLVVLFFLSLVTTTNAALPLFGKKKAKKEIQENTSDYKKLTGRDSVEMQGVMNVIQKGDSVLLELPVSLLL